jgi:Spy/CpxP family protein refolding chaperone
MKRTTAILLAGLSSLTFATSAVAQSDDSPGSSMASQDTTAKGEVVTGSAGGYGMGGSSSRGNAFYMTQPTGVMAGPLTPFETMVPGDEYGPLVDD